MIQKAEGVQGLTTTLGTDGANTAHFFCGCDDTSRKSLRVNGYGIGVLVVNSVGA